MALQNDDGRGSVRGMRDRWRAERSPSAKSELLKVDAMTTPNAESVRKPDCKRSLRPMPRTGAIEPAVSGTSDGGCPRR